MVSVNRFLQRFVFGISAFIFVAVVLGFAAGAFGWFGVRAGSDQDGAYRQMRVYAEVLKKIQTDYVTDASVTDVTTGALHGLLDSLDADSSYLTPTEYKIFKEHRDKDNVQVGLVLSRRFGYAVIVTVEPGSAAEKEHLSDGDVIESIDGQSTHELSLAVMRLMLEGKAGSTVALSVVRSRKQDADKITLTRGVSSPPALAEQLLDNGKVLYLKPGILTAARVSELAAKIREEGKSRKIILDLRETALGEPANGLLLANLFIKQGTMAALGGQKFPLQTFVADPTKTITDSGLVVLVNHGTSGAAELTAAAIAGLKRGDVVGEKTFGEGSVQKTIELPDGAALILTVAKYSAPDGKKIQDEAVTPTVAVGEKNDEDIDESAPAPAKSTEPASAKTPSAPVKTAPASAPKSDEILDKALELMRAKTTA